MRRPADFLILLGMICAMSVFLCLLIYRTDNKYTAPGPQGRAGVITLSARDIERAKPVFLIHGWEYYSGKLLTPKDFLRDRPEPDRYVFIGQYGGFEAGDSAASPHGSASYRLTVRLPEEPRSYTLELPEIFSAYRAYINGSLVVEMGEPSPQSYRPETGNRSVTFEAQNRAEILIAVSDFSHLYSGMVYPPAFGAPETVAGALYSRFLFRAILCACVMTIGLMAFLVGLLAKRMMPAALYGLLCLLYIGYACYPIVQTLLQSSQSSYVVENFSFCAMLLTVCLLARHISGVREKWSRPFLWFGAAMGFVSLIMPFALAAGSLIAMRAYSWLVSFYEWAAAGYIAYAAIIGTLKSTEYIRPILCGAVTFTTALVMDRLLPLHEPIVTGWFIELASFILILSIGVAIGQEVAAQYRDKAVLHERTLNMERLLSLQQTHYAALQKEMEHTKTMRHDMRHHFNMLDGFVKSRQYERLEAYIASLGITVQESDLAEYSANRVVNVLAHHYAFAARQNEIAFDFRCEPDAEIAMPDAELCGLLSNLLENAIEACLRTQAGERFVRVAVTRLGRMLSIHMENSTDESLIPHGRTFLSTKGGKHTGYGLASIKAIVQKYDGTADFTWHREKRRFTSHVTLICQLEGK